MMKQAEEPKTSLEILPTSNMSIRKLKRKRSTSLPSSVTGMQHVTQSKKRLPISRVLGRRVETLKELIPNSHECIGVDGLFRETADYILALQLKVQVMKTLIDLLSNSGKDY